MFLLRCVWDGGLGRGDVMTWKAPGAYGSKTITLSWRTLSSKMSSDQTGQLLGSQAQRTRGIVVRVRNDKAHSLICHGWLHLWKWHCFWPQGWNGEGKGESERASVGTVDSMPGPVSTAQEEEELFSEAGWNASLFLATIFEYVHTSGISLLIMPLALQRHFCLM